MWCRHSTLLGVSVLLYPKPARKIKNLRCFSWGLCYNIHRQGVLSVTRDEDCRGSLPELYRRGVRLKMKWLELMIKLLHYVAVTGAYATVFEMLLELLYDWLSH